MARTKYRWHKTSRSVKFSQLLSWLILIFVMVSGSWLIHQTDHYLSKPDNNDSTSSPVQTYNGLTFQQIKFMKTSGIVMIVIGIVGMITIPMTAFYGVQDFLNNLSHSPVFWGVVFAGLIGTSAYIQWGILTPNKMDKKDDKMYYINLSTFIVSIVVFIICSLKMVTDYKMSDANKHEQLEHFSNQLKVLGKHKGLSKNKLREIQECMGVTDDFKSKMKELKEASKFLDENVVLGGSFSGEGRKSSTKKKSRQVVVQKPLVVTSPQVQSTSPAQPPAQPSAQPSLNNNPASSNKNVSPGIEQQFMSHVSRVRKSDGKDAAMRLMTQLINNNNINIESFSPENQQKIVTMMSE